MMNQITEQQFLDALLIVRQYKTQVNEIILDALGDDKLKTRIEDFIAMIENNGGEISVRLKNVLKCQNKIKYIEDFDRVKFFQISNAGAKSWRELCELTGRDYNK